jgi:5-methylcytosine-specific restriction endonuclease McrA
LEYISYIGSEAWRYNPARLKAPSDADGRCRLCYERGPLEVHHSNYRRLGFERETDLIALCGACHLEVTSIIRARRYSDDKPKRGDVVHLHDARILQNDPTAGSY